MKTIRLFASLFALAFIIPLTHTGCGTPPSQRVVAVQTLKSVGQSAETSVALSAQLYRDHKISANQARQVMDMYDTRFQPAFRLAVAAAQANLDSIASPDVLALAENLASLVSQFQAHPLP